MPTLQCEALSPCTRVYLTSVAAGRSDSLKGSGRCFSSQTVKKLEECQTLSSVPNKAQESFRPGSTSEDSVFHILVLAGPNGELKLVGPVGFGPTTCILLAYGVGRKIPWLFFLPSVPSPNFPDALTFSPPFPFDVSGPCYIAPHVPVSPSFLGYLPVSKTSSGAPSALHTSASPSKGICPPFHCNSRIVGFSGSTASHRPVFSTWLRVLV